MALQPLFISDWKQLSAYNKIILPRTYELCQYETEN